MARSIFCYSESVTSFFYTQAAERPHFCRFAIFHVMHRDKPLHEIITNANGVGRWVYDDKTGNFIQVRGTAQYSIPRTTQGLRRALKRELYEVLCEKAQRFEATDEELQIMAVLGDEAR